MSNELMFSYHMTQHGEMVCFCLNQAFEGLIRGYSRRVYPTAHSLKNYPKPKQSKFNGFTHGVFWY